MTLTKQQLLALLRAAFNRGDLEAVKFDNINVDQFIIQIERTNKVGNLELPDLPQQPDSE